MQKTDTIDSAGEQLPVMSPEEAEKQIRANWKDEIDEAVGEEIDRLVSEHESLGTYDEINNSISKANELFQRAEDLAKNRFEPEIQRAVKEALETGVVRRFWKV
jgi:hypothetical protein